MRSVHPRTRGEHRRVGVPADPYAGSSPHTRGTFDPPAIVRSMQRFIPAHAGNMQTAKTPAGRLRFIPAHAGNMRRFDGIIEDHRFIPAHAGNIGPSVFPSNSEAGSSPHTRGTSLSSRSRISAIRFIPAHAGNIQPRIVYSPNKYGSSPHTRGTSAGMRR